MSVGVLAILAAATSGLPFGARAGDKTARMLPGPTVRAIVPADEQVGDATGDKPSAKKDQFRFKGKDFAAWKEALLTELDAERQIEAIKALGTFGVNGFHEESAAAILELIKRKDARSQSEPDDAKVIDTAQSTIARIGTKAFPVIDKELASKSVNDRRWAAWTLNCMMARFSTGAVFYSGHPADGVALVGAGGAPGMGAAGAMGGAIGIQGGVGGFPGGGMGALGMGGLGAGGFGAGFPAGGGFGAGLGAARKRFWRWLPGRWRIWGWLWRRRFWGWLWRRRFWRHSWTGCRRSWRPRFAWNAQCWQF